MIRNGLEPWHLIIVFAVIVLVFGGKKLPELARGMGQGLRIFRSEVRAAETEAGTTTGPDAVKAAPSEPTP